MSFLLMCAAYFAAVLVSTVILIRLRPEWLLAKGGGGEGDLSGLTADERREYHAYIRPYSGIHHHVTKALRELSDRRLASRDAEKYQWVGGTEAWCLVFIGPFLMTLGLPVSICIRGAVNSVNTSERTRAAIERELTAARKEIDDLLRGDAHAQ